MGSRGMGREVPAGLASIRRRLESWRRTRKKRRRIPEPVWSAAVKVAGRHGVNRTANVLRLDYYSLKDRVEREETSGPGAPQRWGRQRLAGALMRMRSRYGGIGGAPPILNTFTKSVSPQGHDTVRSSAGVWTLPRLPPTVMATA